MIGLIRNWFFVFRHVGQVNFTHHWQSITNVKISFHFNWNYLLSLFQGCICGFSTIICALCLIHFFKFDEEEINSTGEFNLSPLLANNNSDDESQETSLTKAFTNDSTFIDNMTKKSTNVANADNYYSPKKDMHRHDTNFSFVNSFGSNFK